MRDRVHPIAAPDIAAHQAEAGSAGGIHRKHRVHQHAVGIAFLHRTKSATALRRGRERHLAAVPGSSPGQALDQQNMPPGTGRVGQRAPAFDDLPRCHLRIGEEPTNPLLAFAGPAQPAQAYRLAHNHLFEDRSPPLSRRRSPNVPSDQFIAAHMLPLPQAIAAYCRRVGPITIRFPHYLWACPSAKAGAGSWIRTLRFVIAHHSAPQCLEPDPRNPQGQRSDGRTQQAGYMTAPDRAPSTAVASCLTGAGVPVRSIAL
jgi:hypothetical protein